jgi:hypothetical protein
MQAPPLHQNRDTFSGEPNIFRFSNAFSNYHFIDTTEATVHINDILRGYTSNRNYKYGRQNLFMGIKICRAKIQNCPCAGHAFLKGELGAPLILHLGARWR